jgi:cytochrome P450
MPINSIAAIFDISPDYYDKLHVWTFALMRRIGQMGTREEQIADARCVVEMKEFIAKLVTERKGALGNDLLSDLITAKVDGHSALSRNELLSTVLLLLLGGAETTQSLLIAAMARLTQNPAQLDLLRKDLTLIPRVIEETLRFDPPAVGVWRIARHDTELAGVPIPKGAIVMVRLDSANRDEAVFEDPDRFDILRPQSGAHIAFGTGIHFCLGFRLAREQSTQSIRALVKRLEKVRMIVEKSDLRPHPSVSSRCMRELHLAFVPGTAGLNRAA